MGLAAVAEAPGSTAEDLAAEQAILDGEGTAAETGGGGGEPPERDPLHIDAGGQLTMNVGGKAATGSSLRVVGGKFSVGGQYKKGQTIKVELTMVVGEVAFADIRDSATGQVVSCERRHKATVTGVDVLA